MRIYYFGELIEDTNNPKQKALTGSDARAATTVETVEKNITTQTTLLLDEAENTETKTGMPSLGDLLQDIDMSLDAVLPFRFRAGVTSS